MYHQGKSIFKHAAYTEIYGLFDAVDKYVAEHGKINGEVKNRQTVYGWVHKRMPKSKEFRLKVSQASMFAKESLEFPEITIAAAASIMCAKR